MSTAQLSVDYNVFYCKQRRALKTVFNGVESGEGACLLLSITKKLHSTTVPFFINVSRYILGRPHEYACLSAAQLLVDFNVFQSKQRWALKTVVL